ARGAVTDAGDRIHGGAEALVARQRPQVQALEAEPHQPEAGVHQRAEQSERREAEPVRWHRHAHRPRVECRQQVLHGLSASARNAGGTKLRSVASRIAMRIWNSSTSAGTGFW